MAERPAVEKVTAPTAPYRVVNPLVTRALSWGPTARRVGRALLLLHVTGRRTGRVITVPVAHHPSERSDRSERSDEGQHGEPSELVVLTAAPWRVNLRGGAAAEVTYLGERRSVRAELVEAPAEVASTYRALIERIGHRSAGPRMGIRINVDRVPTQEELEEAVRRDGLSVIRLILGE